MIKMFNLTGTMLLVTIPDERIQIQGTYTYYYGLPLSVVKLDNLIRG